jgi:archaellum component FlaC
MANLIREQVITQIQQEKANGNLNPERLREIVKTAVADAIAQAKLGTDEIHANVVVASGLDELQEEADSSHAIVEEAVTAAIEQLPETDADFQSSVHASVEGAIEGLSHNKRQAIQQAQQEVQSLQAQIDDEERSLHEKVNHTLNNLESKLKQGSEKVVDAVKSATHNFRDTEEFALMQKRYAQLQSQLAILRANLTARYGSQYEGVKKYLDEAQTWYEATHQRAIQRDDLGNTPLQRKQSDFANKLGEAGSAAARREKQIRRILRELWELATGDRNAA